MTTREILVAAKAAAPFLAAADTQIKNKALLAMADALVANAESILQANAKDMEAAAGKVAHHDLIASLDLLYIGTCGHNLVDSGLFLGCGSQNDAGRGGLLCLGLLQHQIVCGGLEFHIDSSNYGYLHFISAFADVSTQTT